MKLRITALFLILSTLLFCFCKKTGNLNGTVAVRVTYNLQPATTAVVYMKKGGTPDSLYPLSQYQENRPVDGNGIVYFEDLESGPYFFFSSAKLNTGTVTGITTATVEAREPKSKYETGILYSREIGLN